MKKLPYAVYSDPAGGDPFAMEAAVTLLTVEGRRGKGGMLGLRRAGQGVSWISRFVWPMLALPVSLPDPAGAGADLGGHKALLFDLCGLVSSSIPGFVEREGYAGAVEGVDSEYMSASEFSANVQALTATLKQERKPLQSALSAVRGLARRGGRDGGDEVEGFLSGQSQLAKDLLSHLTDREAADWPAADLARSLTAEDARQVAEEIAERIRAYAAQAQEVERMAAEFGRAGEAYPAKLAEMRDEVSRRYEEELDAVRPEVEEIVAGHQRDLEEKLTNIAQQFVSTITSHEAGLSRADQEVERYRSLGKGYESQLAEARRVKSDAQRQLDAANRERESASKQTRDHFRSLIEQANERVTSLLKQRDSELKGLTELERSLETALRELRSAAGTAAGNDRKAAAQLAALAQPAPQLAGDEPVEFGLPFYIARIEGQKTSYAVLGPITLASRRGLMQQVRGGLSGLIGGLNLPGEPRSGRYADVLVRALTTAFEGSGDASGAEAVLGSVEAAAGHSSVLGDSHYQSQALRGLDQLKAGGWLNDKQYNEQSQAIARLFGGG